MLNQNLSQKLLQKLSPQQIQLMKLLQIPTVSLEERIKEELELNPALEEASGDTDNEDDLLYSSTAEDYDLGDYDRDTASNTNEEDDYSLNEDESEDIYEYNDDLDLSDYYDDTDDTADYKLRDDYGHNNEDDNKTIPIAVYDTFHENLHQQLSMLELSEIETAIAHQIIGSIDDDGYLRREIEAIVDDLAFAQNIHTTEKEIERLLRVVQTLEPPGIGARDLRECLLLQIHRKNNKKNISIEIAEEILENNFDEFVKKHYDKLIRQLGIDDDDLRDAINEILKLNPKPGSAFINNAKPENYTIPDFIILNVNGELQLSLNSRNAPDLRVSETYRDMLKDYTKSKSKSREQKEAVMFIKQKIDAAKWFIDAIKQRQNTMMKTMSAILDYQYEYFLTGDETKIHPMILKDIAERTDLDISTISRVSNSKYVQTEFGTFQLKSFFSESLQTESGEEVSTREVKKILSDLMEKESKRNPLSDQRLTEELMKRGYNIARRTVAKYREQLNVPVARLRKQI